MSPDSVVDDSVIDKYRCLLFCHLDCVDILRNTGWRILGHWDAGDLVVGGHPYNCTAGV